MNSDMAATPHVGDQDLAPQSDRLVRLGPRNAADTLAATRPPGVSRVAIVGAGMMGTAIAAANVRRNLSVLLADADEQALNTAPARIAQGLSEDGRALSPGVAETVGRLVSVTADERRIGACDLVLESIVESAAAKQQLLARLEPHLRPATLLATNTSTIPIARLAATLTEPGRLVGLHFFHPVRRRPLVEVVRGPQTADRALAMAAAYVRRLRMEPILVCDGPGFVVNRLLSPYLAEALDLLLEGATVVEIERAATEFGMALGPLRLMDEIGLDTVLLAGRVLWDAFPERVVPSPLLVSMVKAKRLGRKTGAGFFAYRSGAPEPPQPDPHAGELIAEWSRAHERFTAEGIVLRLLLPMVLEATRVLEERRVSDPGVIDLGAVLGLGFPAARGGPLRWTDSLGTRRLAAKLLRWEHLGPRWQPTPLLLELARRSRRFYARAA